MQDMYKKIANGLMDIRRDYPPSQPKIYSLLDQVEKLYTSAKKVEQKKENFKEQLQAKVAENVALKTELKSVKEEVLTIKKAIETTKNEVDQKLDEERLRIDELLQERKTLQSKLNELENQKKLADNDEEKKDDRMVSKKNSMMRVSQKLARADHPSLSRISTSEPSSPR